LGQNQNKNSKRLRVRAEAIIDELKDIYDDPDFVNMSSFDMVMWNHYYLREILKEVRRE